LTACRARSKVEPRLGSPGGSGETDNTKEIDRMNRRDALVVLMAASLCLVLAPAAPAEDGPWLGSYEMRLPDELAQHLQDVGAEPFRFEITLHGDGSYTSEGTENGRELAGRGSYAVDGSRITLTETERNGKPVTGENEPIVVEGRDGFATMVGEMGGMVITFVRK